MRNTSCTYIFNINYLLRRNSHSTAESGIHSRRRRLTTDYKSLLVILDVLESSYVPRVVETGGRISEDRERHVLKAIYDALELNVNQKHLPPMDSYHVTMRDVGSRLNDAHRSEMPVVHRTVRNQNSRLVQTRHRQKIINLCGRIHAFLRNNNLSLRIKCET